MKTAGGKKEIIASLKKEILLLEGFKPALSGDGRIPGLGPIAEAFPYGCFPTGAVHELIAKDAVSSAATTGFLTGLLSALLAEQGRLIWITASRLLFPTSMSQFGVPAERVVTVRCRKPQDILWVMEESLKCSSLTAVVAESTDLSFMASRRLQLAVEHSGVTGFVLRYAPRQLQANTCAARWHISTLPSQVDDGFPGIGFSRWQVELSRVRNGRPGRWEMEWRDGLLVPSLPVPRVAGISEHRKVG